MILTEFKWPKRVLKPWFVSVFARCRVVKSFIPRWHLSLFIYCVSDFRNNFGTHELAGQSASRRPTIVTSYNESRYSTRS
jgi:hypothetical protein